MFVGTAPAGHALGVLAIQVQGHQAGREGGRGTEIGQQVEKCDGEKSADAQQIFQVGKDSSLTFC